MHIQSISLLVVPWLLTAIGFHVSAPWGLFLAKSQNTSWLVTYFEPKKESVDNSKFFRASLQETFCFGFFRALLFMKHLSHVIRNPMLFLKVTLKVLILQLYALDRYFAFSTQRKHQCDYVEVIIMVTLPPWMKHVLYHTMVVLKKWRSRIVDTVLRKELERTCPSWSTPTTVLHK